MIDFLIEAASRDDRALLAQLRRAASRETEAAAYPIVARFFPAQANPWLEGVLVDVAVLFAEHPEQGERSLAGGLRQLADREGSGDGVERRFVALLGAHAEDVTHHLRHAVALLRGAEIALDWNDLFDTLRNWGHPDRFAQRRWARAFWSARTDTNTEDQEATP
ncbi:MAG: type I-E CRISPR-associated protein Cse2/CasB [Deltaproteobacteria bacterium]|nr:type I-E CRISPR-associated protein Cse2/CasB [Deltaproteobacteria bacterium]